MDNERLNALIDSVSGSVEGELGYWTFEIETWPVVVITDENADRMRIMSPVVEQRELDPETATTLLAANFDRALDARYAAARGYVWSVFIHPLASLTDEQFLDGLSQVVTLAENFGGSFSSTNLVFQGGQN